MSVTSRFLDAFALAFELHQNHNRKGSDIPYITHLMAVSSLVGEYGGTEDQMIAALLHDAIEDQGGPEAREKIRAHFNDHIVRLVDACTDTDEDPKPPWRHRKEKHLKSIESASDEVRLIIAADKLHNVRSIMIDLRERGQEVWSIFSGKRKGSLWYYREIVNALAHEWDHPILSALADDVQMLHDLDEMAREAAEDR